VQSREWRHEISVPPSILSLRGDDGAFLWGIQRVFGTKKLLLD